MVDFQGRSWQYSVPSTRSYPHQWLWDSAFHAIVWSLLEPARGREELRSLFRWQQPNGFIPHIIYWHPERAYFHLLPRLECINWGIRLGTRPRTSSLIQPPVLASAVERLVQAGETDFLAEALPTLDRYYRHLARERDPDSDGLISTIVQFETGLDYSPAYDASFGAGPMDDLKIFLNMRRVEARNRLASYNLARIFARNDHAEDVLVNTLWIDNLCSLARLAESAGDTDLAAWAKAKSAQAIQSLLERAWDPDRGLFFNLVGKDETRTGVKTIQCLMPLLLDDLPSEVVEKLLAHLTNPREFWPSYPVPSVALDEPSYTEDSRPNGRRLIWRGPCSMNTNWFLRQGLLRHGESRYAAILGEKSREMVEMSDFNEFYNAKTGAQVGAKRLGWATLAIDMA